MRILAIILMMIIGISHGWAKPGADLFWSQGGAAPHLAGPQAFFTELGAGVPGPVHSQFKGAGTPLPDLMAAKSPAHVEVGYVLCSAEIAANHSPVCLLSPEPGNLFSSEKPAMPGFESNSFIFRPPIF